MRRRCGVVPKLRDARAVRIEGRDKKCGAGKDPGPQATGYAVEIHRDTSLEQKRPLMPGRQADASVTARVLLAKGGAGPNIAPASVQTRRRRRVQRRRP